MNFAKLGKNPLVVALIAALLVGVFLSSIGLSIGPTDTEHQIFVQGNALGKISSHIELNADQYATGWKPDSGGSISESISVDVATFELDTRLQEIDAGVTGWSIGLPVYWYEYYENGVLLLKGPDRSGFTDIGGGTPGVFTGNYALPPDYNLVGASTGIVQVLLKGVVEARISFLGVPFLSSGTVLLAAYGAELVSGEGWVLNGDAEHPDVVEEGGEAKFRLKTGYSPSTWKVTIRGPSGQVVDFQEDGFVGQNDFNQDVSFTVPFGWFVPGGNNQVTISLSNGFFDGTVGTVFVIPEGEIEQIPGTSDVSHVGTLITGSTTTVTLRADQNPLGLPISHFRVQVYYGSIYSMPGFDFPELYIAMNKDVSATGGLATFTFTVPDGRDGQVSIKANAIDTDGRAGLAGWDSMMFRNQGDPIPPPPPPPPIDGFMWTALAIIIAGLGFMAVAFVIWAVNPITLKIMLAIFIGAIILALVWFEGTGGLF